MKIKVFVAQSAAAQKAEPKIYKTAKAFTAALAKLLNERLDKKLFKLDFGQDDGYYITVSPVKNIPATAKSYTKTSLFLSIVKDKLIGNISTTKTTKGKPGSAIHTSMETVPSKASLPRFSFTHGGNPEAALKKLLAKQPIVSFLKIKVSKAPSAKEVFELKSAQVKATPERNPRATLMKKLMVAKLAEKIPEDQRNKRQQKLVDEIPEILKRLKQQTGPFAFMSKSRFN